MNTNTLKESTYAALLHLQPDSPQLYRFLLQKAQQEAVYALQEKPVIKLGFLLTSISSWIGDGVFRLFLDDPRFEVTALIAWQKNMNRAHEEPLAIEHFRAAGLPYQIGNPDSSAADYDVLFFCTPYIDLLEGRFDIKDIPLSTLICFTSYGFHLPNVVEWQFNLPLHNICWKHFIHAKAYRDLAQNYCSIGDQGMIYSGYPKVDPIVGKALKKRSPSQLWKMTGQAERCLKIIYAPHHSIGDVPFFSTFPQNFRFFLEYARTHPDTTSWIIKPHPLLRVACVKNGLFPSDESFNQYLDEWNSLPNACTLDGEYIREFPDSDCMILDSVSFMAEYLYVNKPILFLKRPEAQFNEFGEKVYNALYHVDGADFSGIAEFIEQTVWHDTMKACRRELYETELDYYTYNHMPASQYIYKHIRSELKKKLFFFR